MNTPDRVAVTRDDWDDAQPVADATTYELVVRVASGVQLRHHLWTLLRHPDHQTPDQQEDLIDLRAHVQADIETARAELRARHAPRR